MYNPEAILWPEGYFTTLTEEELDEVLSEVVLPLGMENDFASTVLDDEVLEDDNDFERLVREINHEVAGMNENEVEAYMQNRMSEFWPALLAAALPTVIQMAPQVISAVGSLVSKGTAHKAAPPPQPAPLPQQASPAAKKVTTAVQVPVKMTPVVRTGSSVPLTRGNDTGQILSALTGLLQSPAVQQLLNNLSTGQGQSVITTAGQQIGASNVLGVLSSLTGSLANALSTGRESSFPEYTLSEEGRFLIDPHDPVQEAELILDLINA